VRPERNRLLSIDALRGIAALVVLLYHSRAIAWIGMDAFVHEHPVMAWSWNPAVWLAWITSPFRVGLIGVQLLFVLSGYCIHRNQARTLAAGRPAVLDVPRYAFRRFFRIYPTYVAALVVNGAILYALLPWLQARGFPNPNAAENAHHSWYVFGMNLLTMQNILVPPYEGVFWSLSIEIHLYVAYLVVLRITRWYGPGRMLWVAFAAGLLHAAASLVFHQPAAVLVLKALGFTHYWFTWCVGAYVAEMQFGRAKGMRLPGIVWAAAGAAGTGLLVACIAKERLRDLQLEFPAEVLIALMMAAFLAWSIRPSTERRWDGAVGHLLGFVGTFSYSLYAIHVPILIAFTCLWGGKPASILPSFVACAVALMVAYVFFNVVERWTLTPPKNFFVTKKPPAPPTEAEVEAPRTVVATVEG
jgi:peptidoglycan/LPS O-acetylase OafA/YrhL